MVWGLEGLGFRGFDLGRRGRGFRVQGFGFKLWSSKSSRIVSIRSYIINSYYSLSPEPILNSFYFGTSLMKDLDGSSLASWNSPKTQ